MSTQRLTFLYPHLFRAARQTVRSTSTSSRCRRPRPAAAAASAAAAATSPRRRHAVSFGTSTASKKASFAPRSGKGIEPPNPLGGVQGAPALESHMTQDVPPADPPEAKNSTPEQRKDAAKELDPAAQPPLKQTLSLPGESSAEKKKVKKQPPQQQLQPPKQSQPQQQKENTAADAVADSNEAASETSQDGVAVAVNKKRAPGPMDAVLHISPPEDVPTEEKPPHLTPPPYVHHFDSYSLVKQLEEGGWTNAQAITAMKAVRGLLAQNLEVAQGGLIGKSDVENETYLFRAACAELSTEVRNNRRINDEQLRQQRTVLQHEVDNTTQVMNQELLTLNDNVKGMFNDRKMAVREEQKAAESAVGSLPYIPISFLLFSYLLS